MSVDIVFIDLLIFKKWFNCQPNLITVCFSDEMNSFLHFYVSLHSFISRTFILFSKCFISRFFSFFKWFTESSTEFSNAKFFKKPTLISQEHYPGLEFYFSVFFRLHQNVFFMNTYFSCLLAVRVLVIIQLAKMFWSRKFVCC